MLLLLYKQHVVYSIVYARSRPAAAWDPTDQFLYVVNNICTYIFFFTSSFS